MRDVGSPDIHECFCGLTGSQRTPGNLGRHTFVILHDRLGHPRSSMMWRIIEHSLEHPLKNQNIILPNEYSCAACSQGKLIVIPSFNKVTFESLVFLERIHEDMCGPIHPPCGPFRYFMVLIDTSTR